MTLLADPLPAAADRPRRLMNLPVGTIRVRIKSKTGYAVRMVKVRMDGPSGKRWRCYARWWWENNRGLVPAGKRVAHANGDCLDDREDGSNYVLATSDDVLNIQFEACPGLEARMRRRQRKATQLFNAERAEVRRQSVILTSLWYAVDFGRRSILMAPHEQRYQVLESHGLSNLRNRNGRGCVGAALGWPGRDQLQAWMLAVLHDAAAWLPGEQLRSRMIELRHHWGQPASLLQGTFYSTASALHAHQMVLVNRRGDGAQYRISPSGLATRRSACPYLPVRGSELLQDRFDGFERKAATSNGGAR